MKLILAALMMVLAPPAAWAGAWTQAPDSWQIITGIVASDADRSFGSAAPIDFRKLLLQTDTEYGWRDGVTLFAATESADVEVAQSGAAPYRAFDNSLEGGVRVRLDDRLGWEDLGILSVEVSGRAAGAFNFAVSADRRSGGDGGELRLLYGRSFALGGRQAYVDLEAGEQWLSGGRANETALDLTAGLWLADASMVMLQSFNLSAGAAGTYAPFESHKLELSWVQKLSDRFLVQAGGFFSPEGSNALVEQGLCLALWSRF